MVREGGKVWVLTSAPVVPDPTPHPRREFPRVAAGGLGAEYLDICKVACLALPKCDVFYVHHAGTSCYLAGEDITEADRARAAAAKAGGWALGGGRGKGEVAKGSGTSGFACWRKTGTCDTIPTDHTGRGYCAAGNFGPVIVAGPPLTAGVGPAPDQAVTTIAPMLSATVDLRKWLDGTISTGLEAQDCGKTGLWSGSSCIMNEETLKGPLFAKYQAYNARKWDKDYTGMARRARFFDGVYEYNEYHTRFPSQTDYATHKFDKHCTPDQFDSEFYQHCDGAGNFVSESCSSTVSSYKYCLTKISTLFPEPDLGFLQGSSKILTFHPTPVFVGGNTRCSLVAAALDDLGLTGVSCIGDSSFLGWKFPETPHACTFSFGGIGGNNDAAQTQETRFDLVPGCEATTKQECKNAIKSFAEKYDSWYATNMVCARMDWGYGIQYGAMESNCGYFVKRRTRIPLADLGGGRVMFLEGASVAKCKKMCCALSWCNSFDVVRNKDSAGSVGSCRLHANDGALIEPTQYRGRTVMLGIGAPGISLVRDDSWDHFSGRYGTPVKDGTPLNGTDEEMSSSPRSPKNKDVLTSNLNAIPDIARIYEEAQATTFYIAAGVITVVCMCCGCYGYQVNVAEEEASHARKVFDRPNIENPYPNYVAPSDSACAWATITVGFKVFDMMSDWAVFAIAMHSPRLTVSSSIGDLNGGGHEALKWTSLFFCILGTLTWLPDHWSIVERTRTAGWALCVVFAEDLP